MPYVVNPIAKDCRAGHTYRTWVIEETAVGAGSEWAVTGLPQYFTITLFEAELQAGAGGATGIDPELGLKPGWTAGTLEHVASNEEPSGHVRTGCDLRVVAAHGVLYGRSCPVSGTADKVVTRITIREGH